LCVDGLAVGRLAKQSIRFDEMDTLGISQIAEPKRWKVAEVTKAALRGEDSQFELVFVEVGFGGDFEWATVVLGAADDDERSFDGLIFRFNVEAREFVIEDFARALPPVSEDAHFGFELEVYGVSDAAVGAGASDAEEIACFLWLARRSGETKSDFADGATDKTFGSLRDVPGKRQFLGENVCGATGEKGERHAMAVLLASQAVDHFIESTVAAASDDELATLVASTKSNFGGITRAGGFGEVGFNAAGGEDAARFVQFLAAGIAAAPRVRVVNQ